MKRYIKASSDSKIYLKVYVDSYAINEISHGDGYFESEVIDDKYIVYIEPSPVAYELADVDLMTTGEDGGIIASGVIASEIDGETATLTDDNGNTYVISFYEGW